MIPMSPLLFAAMLHAAAPTGEAAVRAAVERAVVVEGATIELTSFRPPRAGCRVERVEAAPIRVGGAVSLRLSGGAGACSGPGLARVRLEAPCLRVAREARKGALLSDAVEPSRCELSAGRADRPRALPEGARARLHLQPGAVLEADSIAPGPPPGTRVTVRLLAGSVELERPATASDCAAQGCAKLSDGRLLHGTWQGDVLVSEAP